MSKVPAQFAELEPFVERWALADYNDRYATRLASTMPEMEAFYNVIMPRYSAIMDHLNKFDLNELPEAETNLLRMCYSLVQVSFAVEVWKQPRVPDSGAAYLTAFDMPAV
jgi:hypothetical protein